MYEYFAYKCMYHVHICCPWRSVEDLDILEITVNGYVSAFVAMN